MVNQGDRLFKVIQGQYFDKKSKPISVDILLVEVLARNHGLISFNFDKKV